MKRLLRSFLSLVGVFAATALFTGAIPESSPAAGNTVLVLPFQVSAGPYHGNAPCPGGDGPCRTGAL